MFFASFSKAPVIKLNGFPIIYFAIFFIFRQITTEFGNPLPLSQQLTISSHLAASILSLNCTLSLSDHRMIFPVERSNQKALISCAVIFSILPMTAVGLRLLARRMSNRKVDLSDYLMIAACVSL